MRGIITTLDGDRVDIEIIEPAAQYAVLIALLDAAGDYKRSVQTTTHRARPGFRVPRDLAERAGLLDQAAEPEPAPKPVKAAARKSSRKTADVVVPAVEVGGGAVEVEATAPTEEATDGK